MGTLLCLQKQCSYLERAATGPSGTIQIAWRTTNQTDYTRLIPFLARATGRPCRLKQTRYQAGFPGTHALVLTIEPALKKEA